MRDDLARDRDPVIVRTAAPEDANVIERLAGGASSGVGTPERLREAVQAGEVLIADDLGEPVGFVWIQPRGFFGHTFVNLLAVAPAHRKRGCATQLMRDAERLATSDRIFTSTNTSNLAMHELCRKNGWRRCGHIDALDPGDPEIIYVKDARR